MAEILGMEDLTFTNDCAKAVVLAARRIGINPTAFVCALSEGAITSLIECAMRVEDATVICSDGRLVPGLTFHEAVTMLSKALDALADVSMSRSAERPRRCYLCWPA